jgi:hypothetical protein
MVDPCSGEGEGEDSHQRIERTNAEHNGQDQASGREPNSEPQVGNKYDLGAVQQKIDANEHKRKNEMTCHQFAFGDSGERSNSVPWLRLAIESFEHVTFPNFF